MESKLSRELARVYQDPLLLLFLYLSKAYKKLYWLRLLQIIKGYRVRPKLRGLLALFFSIQEVFTRQNGFYGSQLQDTRETAEGIGSLSYNMQCVSR